MSYSKFIYFEDSSPTFCFKIDDIQSILKEKKSDSIVIYHKPLTPNRVLFTQEGLDQLIIYKESSPNDYDKILRFLHCNTVYGKFEGCTGEQWNHCKESL